MKYKLFLLICSSEINEIQKQLIKMLKNADNSFAKQKYIYKKFYGIFAVKLLFLLGICNLHSQPMMTAFSDNDSKVAAKNKLFDFRLSTEISSATMRYDRNSNNIITDTLRYRDSLDAVHTYQYTSDFNQQKYNLRVGYLGVENLYCYATLPLAYTTAEEKFTYDSTLTARFQRNKHSKFYAEGLQFDAGYRFNFDFLKNINVTVLGGIFLPFYKYDAISDNAIIDSSDFFKIDNKKIEFGRAFETLIGAKFDFNFAPVRMQLGGIYNQRSEDFADKLHLNFLIGFSNIADTELFANFRYAASMGDYKEKYAVNFWRQALWENYFDVDLGFTIFFTEEFYTNLGYTIRLWGENTLSLKTIGINLGYIIRK